MSLDPQIYSNTWIFGLVSRSEKEMFCIIGVYRYLLFEGRRFQRIRLNDPT